MSLAFGFALPHWKILSGGFSPASLFTAGEQGAWYDPSDYGPTGTLFQDAAGTTPTVMETRARLMLDKSKGLVLGPELVTNGDFSSGTTGWTVGASWVVSTGQAVTTSSSGYLIQSPFPAGDPIGATYQVTLVCSGVSGTVFIGGGQYTSTTLQNGTRTLYLQRTGTSNNILYIGTGGGNATIISISIKAIAGNHATAPSDASSPILRARYNGLEWSEDFTKTQWNKVQGATTPNAETIVFAALSESRVEQTGGFTMTAAGQSSVFTVELRADAPTSVNLSAGGDRVYTTVSVTTEWQRFTVTRTRTGAGSENGFGIIANVGSAAGTVYARRADVRRGSDAALNIPAYQSITTATSYDTAGFPPYLAFDGTDDSFSTASIDFTGTDKMTVFAGVTKLQPSAQFGIIAELSADWNGNSGSMYVGVEDGAWKYAIGARGNAAVNVNQVAITTSSAYSSPVNSVLSSVSDISGDSTTLRLNGANINTATGEKGSGNFGNYPLFIGRRNNTSAPLNGRIYSLIIRGASTTTPLIASTEQWVAGKMRLPI